MAGMAVPGLRPTSTPYGNKLGAPSPGMPMPGAPKPAPQNPSTMQTYGGSTQQTDQMGRVITTTPGSAPANGGLGSIDPSTGMLSQPYGRTPSSITIEDPDQQRRARDLADYNARQLDPYGNYIGPGAAPRATSGGGGGGAGGDGGAGGGLDANEIMGIIDKLKPDPPPAREQAPGLLAREVAPQPVASPAAKSQGFARAKDNASRVANSAMRNLRSEMVSRGIEGSGVEGQLASNILGETARGVADASFQQERAAEDQAWQAAQLGYQGALSQRGQDLGLAGNNFSGNISQRGQDINAQPNMLALAPTVLSLLSRARY